MERIKEHLLAPAFVSATIIAMTMWLGLIGYGAWQILFR
jgi:hypothetical protein